MEASKNLQNTNDSEKDAIKLQTLIPPTFYSICWWFISLLLLIFTTFIVILFCIKMNIKTHEMIFTVGTLVISILFTIASFVFAFCKTSTAPSIYSLILAVLSFCFGLITFQLVSLRYYKSLNESDFISINTLLQLIRWSSIQLYCLNRIVRPLSIFDPLRTIFDLDVVDICLDSLDAAALFQILITETLNQVDYINTLTKVTIILWMLSVSIRLALLYLVHLPSTSLIWKILLPNRSFYTFMAYWFSMNKRFEAQSISDNTGYISRVLFALRFRALQHLLMIPCEIMAIIVRILLFCHGHVQYEQAELIFKNFTGLWKTYRTFHLYQQQFKSNNETKSDGIFQICVSWLYCKCISLQSSIIFWYFIFISSYIAFCAVLNYYLSIAIESWIVYFFSVFDILILVPFILYFKDTYALELLGNPKRSLHLVFVMLLLELNIGCYRIPVYYYKYSQFSQNGIQSFESLTYALMMAVLPYYAFHRTISYWFLKNHLSWNSGKVEDPSYALTSQAACSEGVLDILSCSAFLMMAVDDNLNGGMQRTCVAFSILELLNGGFCFAASAMICHWNQHANAMIRVISWSRAIRFIIDTGAFIARMIVWLKFGVIGSVFMIKNIYHIIHCVASMRRAVGLDDFDRINTFQLFGHIESKKWNDVKQNIFSDQ
eukprot:337322_1